MGTFQELLRHGAAFAEFVLTYLNDPDSSGELDLDCECIIGLLLSIVFFLGTHVEIGLPRYVSRGNPSYVFLVNLCKNLQITDVKHTAG